LPADQFIDISRIDEMHRFGKRFAPFAVIVFCLIASTEGAQAQNKLCDRTSVNACACDLTQLRPLQGAVGEDEVKKKAAEIAGDPKQARTGLESDPIKVILGYGDHFYIVDHHHGAKAWVESADNALIKKEKWIENSVCEVMNTKYSLPFDYASESDFWTAMQRPSLHVWLRNQDGQIIAPSQLPTTVADLPDDPYRTFARSVEKRHGFCKNPGAGDFLEFMWADAAFRKNPKFANADLTDKKVVQAGVLEAHDPKYKCAVAGWTSDGVCTTPPKCPSNP
jgi:hypothetical protein